MPHFEDTFKFLLWLFLFHAFGPARFLRTIAQLFELFAENSNDFKEISASIVDKHALTFVVSEKDSFDQLVCKQVLCLLFTQLSSMMYYSLIQKIQSSLEQLNRPSYVFILVEPKAKSQKQIIKLSRLFNFTLCNEGKLDD